MTSKQHRGCKLKKMIVANETARRHIKAIIVGAL